MNKAKRRLQLSASIISIFGMLGIVIVFFLLTNSRMNQMDMIYDMVGYSTPFDFTQAIIMAVVVLPGIIINIIMLKKPNAEKTYKGLRIASSVLITFYIIYFLFGSISLMTTSATEIEILYGKLFIFPIILLFSALSLFIISFCIGNPKKKLFVEDADLKIQTICRLQQMNLITKEEAKHFIFIQATK